jgi:hypothetical protein
MLTHKMACAGGGRQGSGKRGRQGRQRGGGACAAQRRRQGGEQGGRGLARQERCQAPRGRAPAWRLARCWSRLPSVRACLRVRLLVCACGVSRPRCTRASGLALECRWRWLVVVCSGCSGSRAAWSLAWSLAACVQGTPPGLMHVRALPQLEPVSTSRPRAEWARRRRCQRRPQAPLRLLALECTSKYQQKWATCCCPSTPTCRSPSASISSRRTSAPPHRLTAPPRRVARQLPPAPSSVAPMFPSITLKPCKVVRKPCGLRRCCELCGCALVP